MRIEPTVLDGCFIVHDTVFRDDRGYFFESFNRRTFFEKTGLDINFVQDNQSRSEYGVVRGLHFQTGEHAQAKLVRVLEGKVLDVAVDLRPGSATFGKSFSLVLSADSGTQLFVPRGFAHGFAVLSEAATFFYKCDNYYNKASEGGIMYNDPDLSIDWQISPADCKVSAKDLVNQSFQSFQQAL